MKKLLLLLLVFVSTNCIGQKKTYNIIDGFGTVNDSTTDDREAIIRCFMYAKSTAEGRHYDFVRDDDWVSHNWELLNPPSLFMIDSCGKTIWLKNPTIYAK
jgi:hypothetical protein